MDSRNVQKTGNMFYLYLPTLWCKKYNINGKSEVQVSMSSEGDLIVSPQFQKKKEKHIELDVDAIDIEVLNKIIVASYLNPAASFKINLKEELDYSHLLEQKKLVSIELVEVEGKTITCESSIVVSEPQLLLKTMMSKIKNMIIIMQKGGNQELLDKYEEEIDRNRLMIGKTIISAFTFETALDIRPIELHYISQIARDLERLADHLGLLEGNNKEFLNIIKENINDIKNIFEELIGTKEFDTHKVIELLKKVSTKKSTKFTDMQDQYKDSVKEHVQNISEVLMDWAITKQLEK